jgi:hypothetical protein
MEIQPNIKYQHKKTATIAILLVIVLFFTGTFAWYSISQRALNQVEVTANSGGRIHDDFHNQDILATRSNHANKDVYAENFGENDLLVRVKLSEYLEIDGEAITGGTRDDRSSWSPYVLENEEKARDYVTWVMGGHKVYLPTFNLDQNDLSTDAKGDASDEITGTATGIGDGTPNYFAPAGTHFEADGTRLENASATSHESRFTLSQERDIISMEEWLVDINQVGNFWVVDEDGWAYWADFLKPNKATSLLLSELIIQSQGIEDNMYYAIDVIGEFTTVSDVDNLYNGSSEHGNASSNAQDLIDTIIRGVPVVPETVGEVFADDNGTLWRVLLPDDGNGNALIITEYIYNSSVSYSDPITWTPYEESNLKNDPILGMDAWYTSEVGNDIKEISLEYDYPPGAFLGGGEKAGPEVPDWDVDINLEIARTIAGHKSTVGNGEVFPLSVSEVNHYSDTGALNRIAFRYDDNYKPNIWWLRSPGYSIAYTVGLVHFEGQIRSFGGGSSESLGFRAALWVRK